MRVLALPCSLPDVNWLVDFASDFDGPAWTTALLSLAAVSVSVVAIIRTATPRPHFEVPGVKEHKHQLHLPEHIGYDGTNYSPIVTAWSAHLRQNGPGNAESVVAEVRTPSGEWMPEVEVGQFMGRAGQALVILCTHEKVPGEYRLRVTYRRLPNTRKVRTWETSVAIAGDEASIS